MNDEDYQELLSRATSLMDERLASIPPAAMPSNISMRGRTASYDAVPVETSSEYDFKSYVGDLQIDDSRIRVVPFGVYNNPSPALLRYFMVPNIGGRSIFQDPPPTLSRRSGGGAVYLESVFEVYLTGDPQDPNFRARLLECNIVGLGRDEPHPIKKAELSWEYPLGDWTVDDSEAKAYHLLGVYDADGVVSNTPRYSWVGRPFEYEGRLIPPGAPGDALFAPIKYNITFSEN